MIKKEGNLFRLDTKETTYCFQVLPSGHLEHLYYGKRVEFKGHYEAILPKCQFLEGNLIAYDEAFSTIGLENRCLEISGPGKGDIREPMVELIYDDGSRTCDFVYETYQTLKKKPLGTLPCAYDEKDQVESLHIELVDRNHKVRLILVYSVFEETNVIVRSSKLVNEGEEGVEITRLLSCQLDLDQSPYTLTTFKGAWAREMERHDLVCTGGRIVNDSKTGTSSNRSNPFVMLSKEGTTEDYGACYGINLIYSGNHYEAVEVGSFGKTRLVSGINPFGFSFKLGLGESFEAPEVALTFSDQGYSGISFHMHAFIREHIVRGTWKYKERPVLINSWEASYFDFNESKLVRLAKAASKVGIELFVLDDGWFGERHDDTSSLGDWFVNTKKLPGGLNGLAHKINDLGMDFGIWVEPEMISENSQCYKEHPEYAVKIPGQKQALGRHQMMMDLTKKEVQNYIIEQISEVITSAPIRYVKWDMNRIFTDCYSDSLEPSRQGEFLHRYMMGLYYVLKVLTERFPDVLFESCASGGNRFDLGMLCYMPQIWASDNTDAICRAEIQTGYSYGYPMSVIGAHVSGSPNHQTLRQTSLDTRFQVACFGILGYECNLVDMKSEQLECIKEQVTWYKTYRKTLQFGQYYRLKSNEQGCYQWMVVNETKDEAIGLYLQKEVKPNQTYGVFQTKGLEDTKMYHFVNRPLYFDVREFGDLINTVAPINIKQDSLVHNLVAKFIKLPSEKEDYKVSGSVLNHIGVRLKQAFCGTGYNEEIRYFQDYSSRLYIMEEYSGDSHQTI